MSFKRLKNTRDGWMIWRKSCLGVTSSVTSDFLKGILKSFLEDVSSVRKTFCLLISFVLKFLVGKIAEKAVCRSVFLTMWHCILSAVLTKTHSFRPIISPPNQLECSSICVEKMRCYKRVRLYEEESWIFKIPLQRRFPLG